MKTSQISLAFKKCNKEKRPALLTYTVAGDNTKKKSLEILNSISKYVDILEIGFPHNTPIADGGQIQTSASRALKNGIKMKDVFQIVGKFKKKNITPVILMGYYNMILQYGQDKFLKKCKNVGVNGLIVVDLPWPDNKIFSIKCKKNSICFVQLLSPTTSSARIKKIINSSHEMIYYISMLSTTGGKLKVSPKKIMENYVRIKKIIKNRKKNLVIGFGITSKNISSFKSSDGCVIGSEICQKISESIKNRQNPTRNVTIVVENLRRKLL